MTITADELARRVTTAGLLTADEVRTFLASIPRDQRPREGAALARALVGAGKLTRFQASALMHGQTKGLVLGNYVLLDRIGAGGMGEVYKAHHRRMKRTVALKVVAPKLMESPGAIQRFQREVEAAARLEHANIVAAYDADEADGVHFLVMQYVEGLDLRSLVLQHGPLPVADALDCILQAARGLAYAHAAGVIHRDLKPSNLLRSAAGVKVLDMGLARFAESDDDDDPQAALTSTGRALGTFDYMSPEQAEDTHTADERSDIYSLGCTLWFLLAGAPPYEGDTPVKKILAHREHAIPSLRARRGDVSQAVDAVFARMIAKDPTERYQSMEETIAALESVLTAVAAGATTVAAPPRPGDVGEHTGRFLQFLDEREAPRRGVVLDETQSQHAVQETVGERPGSTAVSTPATAMRISPRARRSLPALYLAAGALAVLLVVLLLGVTVQFWKGGGKNDPKKANAAGGKKGATTPGSPSQGDSPLARVWPPPESAEAGDADRDPREIRIGYHRGTTVDDIYFSGAVAGDVFDRDGQRVPIVYLVKFDTPVPGKRYSVRSVTSALLGTKSDPFAETDADDDAQYADFAAGTQYVFRVFDRNLKPLYESKPTDLGGVSGDPGLFTSRWSSVDVPVSDVFYAGIEPRGTRDQIRVQFDSPRRSQYGRSYIYNAKTGELEKHGEDFIISVRVVPLDE